MISCDFVILGAGEAGILTALKLAKTNSEVILIEENEVGGSWLYSLEFPFFCWQKSLQNQDFSAFFKEDWEVKIQETNTQIQKKLDQKQREILEKLTKTGKIKIIYGKSSFISKSLVEVNSASEHEIINFKQAIITTGKNQINIPELTGIDEVDFWYQHNIFSINTIPKTLTIIGCTLFNLEIANLYANLGCSVKIIEAKSVQQILRFFDSTCLNWTFRELLKKQVSFLFETKIVKVAKQNDQIKLWDNQKNTYLSQKIFIFAKETFESGKINLEKAGIKSDKTGILVNQNGQTIQRNIWAIGSSVNLNKNNLHRIINSLAEKTKNETKNSLVLFGSSGQNFENKNFSEVHRINLDLPSISLGLSYREAESRYGSSISFEIFKDFLENGFVKLTFNQVSGQILGIGLTGKLAENFYSAAILTMSKNTNHRDFRNFLLNSGLELETR